MKEAFEKLYKLGLINKEEYKTYSHYSWIQNFSIPNDYLKYIASLSVNDREVFKKQFFPDEREFEVSSLELSDPIGDESFSPVKGIVHRYPDRVLLKLNLHCPVYCRFCFRREQVGQRAMYLDEKEINSCLGYLKQDKQIWEVIFTGGDPFMLPEDVLVRFIKEIEKISHIKAIRFHTRVAIFLPKRINDKFIQLLTNHRLVTTIVLHVNHKLELSPQAIDLCKKLSKSNVILLSQSVLLKGINDCAEVLKELFYFLYELGIKPYYLHHLDYARGTGHFRVSIRRGRALMEELRLNLSGVCMPQYVLDIPEGMAKVPIENYIDQKKNDEYNIFIKDKKIFYREHGG